MPHYPLVARSHSARRARTLSQNTIWVSSASEPGTPLSTSLDPSTSVPCVTHHITAPRTPIPQTPTSSHSSSTSPNITPPIKLEMPPSALTENIKIQKANGGSARSEVSKSRGMSVSPLDTFHSPPSAPWGLQRRLTGSFGSSAAGTAPLAKLLKPFKEEDIKILLLESVNQTGKDILSEQGYQVESLKSSLPEDQLIEKIKCITTEKPILPEVDADTSPEISMFLGFVPKPS